MTTAVERWAEAGLVEVDLPSRFRVRVRPVAPSQLITAGLLPYDLIGALVEAQDAGEKPSDEVVGRAAIEYAGKERALAARAVRDIWNGDAWERLELDVDAFEGGTFPPDDVEAIVEAAMGRIRAAAEAAEEEEGVDTDGLAAFRGDGPGADDRPDGGALRAAPEQPRRRRRAAARAAAGRGDRAPAREG